MNTQTRLAGILGCAVTFALVGCATNNSMAPTSGMGASGNIVYSSPHYMATRSSAPAVVPNVLFSYYNGPVLVNPKMYLIFWGYKKYGDPDKVAKLLKAYCKVEGGSGHNNIYTQYYDIVGSKTNYITNPKNQCGGAWDDDSDAVPTNPTDLQVANEALAGVAHFGYDVNASYVVATPHGRASERIRNDVVRLSQQHLRWRQPRLVHQLPVHAGWGHQVRRERPRRRQRMRAASTRA